MKVMNLQEVEPQNTSNEVVVLYAKLEQARKSLVLEHNINSHLTKKLAASEEEARRANEQLNKLSQEHAALSRKYDDLYKAFYGSRI